MTRAALRGYYVKKGHDLMCFKELSLAAVWKITVGRYERSGSRKQTVRWRFACGKFTLRDVLLGTTTVGDGKEARLGRGRIGLQCSLNRSLTDLMRGSKIGIAP